MEPIERVRQDAVLRREQSVREDDREVPRNVDLLPDWSPGFHRRASIHSCAKRARSSTDAGFVSMGSELVQAIAYPEPVLP
jgi:hypothetical protein